MGEEGGVSDGDLGWHWHQTQAHNCTSHASESLFAYVPSHARQAVKNQHKSHVNLMINCCRPFACQTDHCKRHVEHTQFLRVGGVGTTYISRTCPLSELLERDVRLDVGLQFMVSRVPIPQLLEPLQMHGADGDLADVRRVQLVSRATGRQHCRWQQEVARCCHAGCLELVHGLDNDAVLQFANPSGHRRHHMQGELANIVLAGNQLDHRFVLSNRRQKRNGIVGQSVAREYVRCLT